MCYTAVICHNSELRLTLILCIDQAKEAIKEAQRCDPDSIFTLFCVYKVAVLENNVEKGMWNLLSLDAFLLISCEASAFSSLSVFLSCRGSECNGTSVQESSAQ